MPTQTFVSVIYCCRQITPSIGIGTRYRYRSRPKVSVSEVSVNCGIGLTLTLTAITELAAIFGGMLTVATFLRSTRIGSTVSG